MQEFKVGQVIDEEIKIIFRSNALKDVLILYTKYKVYRKPKESE